MLAPVASLVIKHHCRPVFWNRPYLIKGSSRREVPLRLPQMPDPRDDAAAERANKIPPCVPGVQHAAKVLDEGWLRING